ncbi:hypothetical protein FA15DRAFT_757378 [Coprinopsis marcescibilis]|uniref:RNA-dependent RNA polymerase n=1 Tax=Coprinopsis marcescibilis TaxID=230819 RepID=A0A5C3KSN7_COPMA|nr:hypothetical protein FA15DRAFT_757378 [Coprinopsis marcescibilis]
MAGNLDEEFNDLLSSQGSSHYGFGEDDITPLIQMYHTQASDPNPNPKDESYEQVPLTQSSTDSTAVSNSAPSSFNSGKRKAEEETAALNSLSRPFKQTRSASTLPFAPPIKLERSESPERQNPKLPTPNLNRPVDLSWPAFINGWFEKLPYGAKYEISRAVLSSGLEQERKFTDLEFEEVQELVAEGTNAKAAKRAWTRFVRNPSNGEHPTVSGREQQANCPWAELDREEEALRGGNPYANLGFNKDGTPSGHYGGRVEFRGTLFPLSLFDKDEPFRVRLERPTLGPSTQFSRRFGSKNIFRLRIQKSVVTSSTGLLNFIRRPFIICGGVFRAFYAKEMNVFFIKTNETPRADNTDPNPAITDAISFLEFLELHNSLEVNWNQKMAKWASRFALGLSNSAPGLMLKPDCIRFEDDIVHPESKSCMTDGAGSVNRRGTALLHRALNWDERPTAVQVRVFGSKGLLIDDLADPGVKNDDPVVYLTPSQIKIKYSTENPDPAHCIIDVLRASQSKTPCRLSVETIINLSENGVPSSAFLSMLRESLKEIIDPLLDWDAFQASEKLWYLMAKIGGVKAARKARENVGAARVKGYSERDLDENEPDDEDGFTQLDIDLAEEKSIAWWGDPISGCPSSLEETIMGLLDAGFTPQDCWMLRFKLNTVTKYAVRNQVKTYRMEVPMSCSAWIVPDRRGVLEEGEIFFKSSRRNIRLPDGTEVDELLGDVLATRNPCKLPTDVQKWKAVYRPELRDLVDVVVLPIKGFRRAADWLAGGDYDGDKVILIWDPRLVVPFKNADRGFGDAPDDRFTRDNFNIDNIAVADFQKAMKGSPSIERIHGTQEHLLSAIQDTAMVGKYSNYHEHATYRLGYTHPETIRLAHMFCMTLDGAKTGLKVKSSVIREDSKYNHRPPAWKETVQGGKRINDMSNQPNLQRLPHLPRFIMDELHQAAQKEETAWLKKIENHHDQWKPSVLDDDLAWFWSELQEQSKCLGGEVWTPDIKLIEKHVQHVYEQHKKAIQQAAKDINGSPRKGASPKKESRSVFTDLPIEKRQDILRRLSKSFASGPDPTEMHMPASMIPIYRGSYAYIYAEKQSCNRGSRFPWDVAYQQLVLMKALRTGRLKAVHGDHYEKMYMQKPSSIT